MIILNLITNYLTNKSKFEKIVIFLLFIVSLYFIMDHLFSQQQLQSKHTIKESFDISNIYNDISQIYEMNNIKSMCKKIFCEVESTDKSKMLSIRFICAYTSCYELIRDIEMKPDIYILEFISKKADISDIDYVLNDSGEKNMTIEKLLDNYQDIYLKIENAIF